MEVQVSGRGRTPQQGVTLSRSVLRIAGDGHVEGAGGGGGSSPTNVPAVGAHEREETGTAARRRAAVRLSRAALPLRIPIQERRPTRRDDSSLMPADA
jgi:hypothetical protein